MSILLAGDIGATKTILRLVKSEPRKTNRDLPEQTTLYKQTFASQEFTDLVPMVRKFLAVVAQKHGSTLAPEKACFGIAGPVVKNTTCQLTNLSWHLDTSRLEQELQVERVYLIDDFIAGGIAAKNLPLMQQGNFMQAFLRKGRMSSLLKEIPVHIVLDPEVGLVGAAVCAAQLTSS